MNYSTIVSNKLLYLMGDVRAVSLFGCRDPQNLNVSTRFMELLNIHQHNQ